MLLTLVMLASTIRLRDASDDLDQAMEKMLGGSSKKSAAVKEPQTEEELLEAALNAKVDTNAILNEKVEID